MAKVTYFPEACIPQPPSQVIIVKKDYDLVKKNYDPLERLVMLS
jgi:hypothetical protein